MSSGDGDAHPTPGVEGALGPFSAAGYWEAAGGEGRDVGGE